MRTATRIDPAVDAQLADIETKLGQAQAIHALAIKAYDALTEIERALDGRPRGEGEAVEGEMFTAVTFAILHIHSIEASAAKEVRVLKAEQATVRGW